VTAGIWLLAPVLLVSGTLAARGGERAGAAIFVAAGVGALALAAAYRRLQPVAYGLDGSSLEIERRGAAARRYQGVVEPLPGARLGIRIAGSGGLYGYLGRFRLVGGGHAHAFLTRRAATSIVSVGDEVVAVSPSDPDAFLSEVEAYRA